MNLAALASLIGVPAPRNLCRLVEKSALDSRQPPDYLFVSGRPGRYNPRGIACIYASEERVTAAAEFERYNVGRTTQAMMYWIHPDATVLDLTDSATLAALGLNETELHHDWRFAPAPTLTQQLGAAIAAQTRLAGIRFPSDAARARQISGSNVVIFKQAVVSPAALTVRDDSGAVVQSWP